MREAQKEIQNLKSQGGIGRIRQTDVSVLGRMVAHLVNG